MKFRSTPAWLLGPLAILLAVSLASPGAGAADPIAGSAGTDTSLPLTESAMTVNGRGVFANLAITVNQTADLNNQAVSITWTGGVPTLQGPGRFGANYLQIMQCWGDDDGSVPGNPGPAPEQCVQGAAAGTYGGLTGAAIPGGFAASRIISRSTWPGFNSSVGYLDVGTTNVWRAFRSVTGTVISAHTDPSFNPSVVGGNFWLNPYFNIITTNEIPGGATGQDGRGAELFEVQTGVQSSGLGCGQRVQPILGDGKKIPSCWLVIVPRGTPTEENAGTPFEESADQFGVVSSPLSENAWKNRIAVPLLFNPVDSPCSLADEERRLSGSELALPAVASWQPVLCSSPGLPPYSYASIGDATARQQLTSGAPGAPGMVVVSRPIAEVPDPKKPILYAPISVSGLAIGFNIERNPTPDAPAAAQQIAGVRIAELNLTPRLVAKLLTQSYGQQVAIIGSPGYSWTAGNPGHMGLDPDFIQFNPEFQELQIADGRTFSGLQLPSGNSDAARLVWEWILADPEALAWLNGEPDQWGMNVNPVYATLASANSTGIAFAETAPSSFPKSDPYCYQAPPRGPGKSVTAPPLCGTDWMPYARSLADSARIARIAFDAARIVENPFAQSSSAVWSRDIPQYLGRRAMLTLTDTPSSAQFGLQTARLSRAGDNSDVRTFVAPDSGTMSTGVASMTVGAVPGVLEPQPSAVAPGAYPLTSVTYAAISPLSLDAQSRSEYASFVEYAAGPGQVPGLELGQLPLGYAPLTPDLQAQAMSTANQIRTAVAAPDAPVTTTTTTVPVVAPAPQTTAQVSVPRTNTRNPSSVAQPPPTTFVVAPSSTEVVDTRPSTTPSSSVPASADEADQPKANPPAVLTPFVGLARSRFAVPGIGALALGSAWGVMEISRRPRRRLANDGADLDLFTATEAEI